MSSVCSNCGRPGHFFRECHEPITSLGLLVFRESTPNCVQWLLVRRKDTLGFIELMRGKYELRDEEGIRALIEQTTVAERTRLQTKPFSDLWLALWNGPASRRYHNEFEQAKAKFAVLRSGLGGRKTLETYCKQAQTAWVEAEWGFPKGRRNANESEIACAMRETWEETGIRRSEFQILEGIGPFVEEFHGSNGICYRHRYWLSAVSPTLHVCMDPSNTEQQREIGDIRWCSYDTAISLIRPYNKEKRHVLQEAAAALLHLRTTTTT
jgi:8-oxo-dGTP pyrophosphatase MutT (NUDIX family)